MDLVQRLQQYIKYTGLPLSQFADQAKIPRPTLSQIIGGRNKKISHELIEKLHRAYPDLSVTWLLFGDGTMLNNGSTPPSAPIDEPPVDSADDEAPTVASEPHHDDSILDMVNTIVDYHSGHSMPQMQKPPTIVDFENDMEELRQNAQPVDDPIKPPRQRPKNEISGAAPCIGKEIDYIMVFYTDNTYTRFNKE